MRPLRHSPRHRWPAVLSGGLLAWVAFFTPASAPARILHVPDEFGTIQYALFAAMAGDTVMVAPGSYAGSLLWPATPSVSLMSEAGPEGTILDGLDAGTVVRIATPVDSTTRIEGFTITRGSATEGGGIACIAASPALCGNWIDANTATWYGAGVYCEGRESTPVIRGNRFHGNRVLDGSGGAVCAYGDAGVILTDNEFDQNEAVGYFGGAVHCEAHVGDGGTIRIERNLFRENSATGGGAVSFFSPFVAPPQVCDNELFENEAQIGGAIYSFWSLADLRRNRVHDNHASQAGGGLLAEESHDLAVIDCEFSHNTAVGYGGGLALVHWCTAPRVTGCTIRENRALGGAGLYCYLYSSPTIRDCQFLDNEATERGGAIFSEYLCSPQVIETLMRDNHAPIGGGVLSYQSQPTITGCVLSANQESALHITLGWAGHVGQVHENSITGNADYGIRNDDAAVPLAAEHNWWGDATGPYHSTQNPGGLGDRVSDHVAFVPWLPDPGGVSTVAEAGFGAMLGCTPNPFRGSTRIECRAAGALDPSARIAIYDVTGRLVHSFLTREIGDGRSGSLLWHGDDDRGDRLPGGVYYVRFESGGRTLSARVIGVP